MLEDELKAADLFSMAWTNPFKRFYDEGEAGAHAPPLRSGPLPLKGDVSLWSHIFFSWYRSCAFVDPILVFAMHELPTRLIFFVGEKRPFMCMRSSTTGMTPCCGLGSSCNRGSRGAELIGAALDLGGSGPDRASEQRGPSHRRRLLS